MRQWILGRMLEQIGSTDSIGTMDESDGKAKSGSREDVNERRDFDDGSVTCGAARCKVV